MKLQQKELFEKKIIYLKKNQKNPDFSKICGAICSVAIVGKKKSIPCTLKHNRTLVYNSAKLLKISTLPS